MRGYYMWSLLDNFSWLNGYKKRYGFLFVDRETMRRYPKRAHAGTGMWRTERIFQDNNNQGLPEMVAG